MTSKIKKALEILGEVNPNDDLPDPSTYPLERITFTRAKPIDGRWSASPEALDQLFYYKRVYCKRHITIYADDFHYKGPMWVREEE